MKAWTPSCSQSLPTDLDGASMVFKVRGHTDGKAVNVLELRESSQRSSDKGHLWSASQGACLGEPAGCGGNL